LSTTREEFGRRALQRPRDSAEGYVPAQPAHGLSLGTGHLRTKAAWYYHRLRSMSVPEIAHRANEQIRRAAWRKYSRGWDAFDIGDGALPVLAGFGSSLSAASPELHRRLVSAADDIISRPLEIFGQQWGRAPLAQALANDPLMFHFDPVSQRHWPTSDYCFDIPYRDPARYGDYKFCSELNTLQTCQILAAAARLEKSEEIERLVWALWNTWYETNLPFRGINWASGVNIALRAVSLFVTVSLLEPHSERTRRRMRALLNASAFWLERYPSLHSSANNHLIAESVALFALGTLCPDLPGSGRYAATGRKRIEQHALRLILPDGAGAEMSPSYTAFAIEWLLLAMVVAESVGQGFSDEISNRVAAVADCFKWLMDGVGNVPSIGDNDNSCVVGYGCSEVRYVASITAAIAGVIANPALAPVSYDLSLRDVLFRTPAPGAAKGDGIRHFGDGGLSIVRETHPSGQAVLIFDHGPLGYLELGAHGHADTLAIWLSLDGQPVLVDAGTYLYGGGGAWREHFRATGAHNTVEVAGRSSSTSSGPFNWSRKARGRLLSADDGTDWNMEAEHDGYLTSLGRKHVRRLTRIANGVRVEDRLEGGSAPVRIGFLVSPDLSAFVEGVTVRVMRDETPIVTLVSLSGWKPQILRGISQPPAGWHSNNFGTKTPASQIVFSGDMSLHPIVTDIIIGDTRRR
jgi:hypothetical protein